MTGLLQDDGDDKKSTSLPGTPINQRRLGFNDYEVSDTGTSMGGDIGGSTSAAKDDKKAGTPRL